MQFGIFDHLDDPGRPAPQVFADRLALVKAYEAAGFERYQLAEHHGTPLGFAPSPNLFLAAAAQCTTTLRLGALVNLLPISDPLRLLEEICMLDNMSNGRLELGLGRGASPVELQFFGVPDREAARDIYVEGLDFLKRALASETVNFSGARINVQGFPMVMPPVQKPHPPIWHGATTGPSAALAARDGSNVVTLGPMPMVRGLVQAYREAWSANHGAHEPMPCVGFVRHVVVADTQDEARDLARHAYGRWRTHMAWLWTRTGVPFPLEGAFPESFDALEARGAAVAGTPEQVRAALHGQMAESGANYLACQMMFGDMTRAQCETSVRLFGRHVMPALRSAFA
ncbi:MAG: hypothetical protein JWN93_2129 [Hyphomicrobiales bacterium]|nr:hypothetical protein [Hyphomicrobiales bacterium]